MEFHERLRHWRTAAGLTQEQLALRCGYSSQSVIANYESRIEKNRRAPDLADIPRLADALGIRSGQLVDDREMASLGARVPPTNSLLSDTDVHDLAAAIDIAQRAFSTLGQIPNAVALAAGIMLALRQLESGTTKAAVVAAVTQRLREIGETRADGREESALPPRQ